MSPILDAFNHARQKATGANESAGDDFERREMIEGIEDLAVTTVKEVMVPRTDTVFIPADASHEETLRIVVTSVHSRSPLYGESSYYIRGILYAKDILRVLTQGERLSLPALVRKPYFVPESKRIDSLLREFRRRRVHIAIVVDEYGGVSGIVSLEDIIEEIVGEIQDEFDDEMDTIDRTGEASWLCDARTDLEDLNKRLGTGLPEDEFDTLGGYVIHLFGRIPSLGEKTADDGFGYTVHAVSGHRITRVLVERIAVPED